MIVLLRSEPVKHVSCEVAKINTSNSCLNDVLLHYWKNASDAILEIFHSQCGIPSILILSHLNADPSSLFHPHS